MLALSEQIRLLVSHQLKIAEDSKRHKFIHYVALLTCTELLNCLLNAALRRNALIMYCQPIYSPPINARLKCIHSKEIIALKTYLALQSLLSLCFGHLYPV
jgi:hypothetical protein